MLMETWTKKKSIFWLTAMIMTTIVGTIIGNRVKNENILGGTIAILILLLIPIGIEFIRKTDPIVYYGLDFITLKKINIRSVLGLAGIVFVTIALLDFYVFDIWKIIHQNSKIAVGSTSVALAKSPYFYLSVFVVFGGTLLEELWFRGLIQYKIKSITYFKKVNPHLAIVLQSILFGLIHFIPIFYGSDFELKVKLWFFVYPAIIGLILGYTNEKYNSLWPGWIIHYTNNLCSILLFTILFKV